MTLTDITNIALEDIGARAVGSIDGDDVNARKVKRRLSNTIAQVCSLRNWSCLVKLVRLSLIDGERSIGGLYKFNAPRGLLKVIEPSMCRIEGDVILHPFKELTIKATLLEENPDCWDCNLTGAILAQLKADIAFMVTGDANLAVQVKQLAEREIQRFIKNDIYRSRGRRQKPPLLPEGYFME